MCTCIVAVERRARPARAFSGRGARRRAIVDSTTAQTAVARVSRLSSPHGACGSSVVPVGQGGMMTKCVVVGA